MHQRYPNTTQNRNQIPRNDYGQQINIETTCSQETKTNRFNQ
jgi:hypothetical protein